MASIANARSIAKSAGFLQKVSMLAISEHEMRLHTSNQSRPPQYLHGDPAGTVQFLADRCKLQSERVVSDLSPEILCVYLHAVATNRRVQCQKG